MLTDLYVEEGTPLKESFGVPYPEYILHPAAEYGALVTAAGVIDLTHWRTLRVTGTDRTSFLQAMLTNEVESLGPNQGCRSLITSTKGKFIADLFLFVRKQEVLVFVAQGDAAETIDVLSKHIIMEDVHIDDISSMYGVVGIEGPKAFDILWRMFPKGPFPSEPVHSTDAQFENNDVLMMKNTVTGEDGFHLMVPANDVRRMRNYLVQAARGSDGLAIGVTAWNMRRVENGLSWFGVDFDTGRFPQEARLDDTVSYTKGCFRGQETLARLHNRGHVNHLLVGLVADDVSVPDALVSLEPAFAGDTNSYDEKGLYAQAPLAAELLDLALGTPPESPLYAIDQPCSSTDEPAPSGGTGDHAGDKPIGRITSTVHSPTLKKPLLLGYLRREFAAAGTRVQLNLPDRVVPLTVIELPLQRSEA